MNLPIPGFLVELLAPDRWPTFAFVSARVGGLMIAAPLWSLSALPRVARAAIALLITILLLPLAPTAAMPEQAIELPLPLAMEFLLGLAVGLTAAMLVQGASLAGEVISIQMGLSLGPVLSPMAEPQPAGVGQIQSTLALLIFVLTNGHLVLLRGLAASLQALPPGHPFAFTDGAAGILALFGRLFALALSAAAPVMVTLILVNLAMALLHRAVPQINTMMVAFPLSIGIGLVMVGAALPLIAATIGGWMQGLDSNVQAVLDAFRPLGGGS
ncbi:MAG: flagellar biosynthetic protein FliR [Candidatus Eisenbacteria bacterium]|nr:flagellar biosynthetic protein FliR [Candidatus Eisenbacteria bacterium]